MHCYPKGIRSGECPFIRSPHLYRVLSVQLGDVCSSREKHLNNTSIASRVTHVSPASIAVTVLHEVEDSSNEMDIRARRRKALLFIKIIISLIFFAKFP